MKKGMSEPVFVPVKKIGDEASLREAIAEFTEKLGECDKLRDALDDVKMRQMYVRKLQESRDGWMQNAYKEKERADKLENENKPTFTGNVVVSSICRAAMKRIEELERQVADLSHDKKMLEEGYVYEDYDPGEGCYEDTHEGKWVKRWEPWRYVKDELPKIEVGYKVAVEVCYLDAYQNPCIKGCDWNGKDFIYQHFDGKKWIFDKKVSLLGKVFAWRYKVYDWPTLSKEAKE